jgi:pimeloyl-ACP methyl ester carboxylesterase
MKRLLFLLILLLATPLTAQEDDQQPVEDLADPDGTFITIDDNQLYYIDLGADDAPVVMLLHGFGGSTFTWRDTIQPLVDAGYRVVAYDRPPFGLSEKSANIPLTLDAQADQAVALMDALDIEQATLVGHSAGGGVISALTVNYPERIDALVFVAGAVPLPVENEDQAQDNNDSPLGGLGELAANLDPANPIARQIVRQFLTRDRFADILVSAYHPSFEVTDDIRAGYSRVLLAEDWELGLLTLLTADRASDPFDVETFITNAQAVLVAIIWGEEDTWVPLTRGEQLAQGLPDAELITYPAVGHLPMEEDSTQFNADLLAFLTTVYES